MIRLVAGPLALTLLCISPAQGLERPDREFKVFQFPPDMIPRIDGQTDDWDIVPETYAIGTDELSDTVVGHGTDHDPEDLEVRVRVGWVNGLNRLYFLYEAYWDIPSPQHDIGVPVTVDVAYVHGQPAPPITVSSVYGRKSKPPRFSRYANDSHLSDA